MAKKVEFNMDIVKKYIFWACTPLGLVIAVGAGWMAIGSIAEDLNKQKQQLESQKTAMSTLRGTAATHPNQKTIETIKEERDQLVDNVLAAWETLVQEQQKRNRWTGLANVAIQEIESKNFLDPLSSTMLSSYLEFAQNAINNLLNRPETEFDIRRVEWRRMNAEGRWVPVETVQLIERSGGESTGGIRRGGSTSAAPTMPGDQMMGKVAWGAPAFEWTMKDWTRRPQAFEVWLTQEDLWVYQALLWVIASSNKDSREVARPFVPGMTGSGTGSGSSAGGEPLNLSGSVIKEIVGISIGSKAAMELAKQSGRRLGSIGLGGGGFGGSSGSSGGMSSFGGSSGGSGGMGGFGGSGSDSMMSGAAMAEAAKSAAMAGRYVDANGEPLMEPDFTGQFRRMPVYLNLCVDQRRISDVLVNCANCPMPIDVMWVKVNPGNTRSFEYSSATKAGTMSGGGSSSFSGSSSEFSMGSSASSTSSRSGAGSRTSGSVDYGSNAVVIEIYGCINIFAPPDRATLGDKTGAAGSTNF